MKTIFNKKFATTLTVLLTSVSFAVDAAQLTSEVRVEMNKAAIQSIEQSMPLLSAEIHKSIKTNNVVGQKKSLAELLISISAEKR